MGRSHSMQRFRQLTVQAKRYSKTRVLKGFDLSCAKCGHVPLGWTFDKDFAQDNPGQRKCLFLCHQCRSSDEIMLQGPPFELTDFYHKYLDRFHTARKQQTKQTAILREEQMLKVTLKY